MRNGLSLLRHALLSALALALPGWAFAQEAAKDPPPPPPAPATVTQAPVVFTGTAAPAGPTNSVQFDWLFMRRETPSSQRIFVNPAGATVLNASDFNFDFETGVQTKIIHQPCDGWGVEFRYFRIFDPTSTATFAIPVGVNTIQTNPPSTFGGGAGGIANFFYRSDISNFELNGRRPLGDRVTAIAGFRYINLNEHLHGEYNFTGVAGQERQDWHTNNNLWGVQTGLDAKLFCSGRFNVDAFARAGIYLNEASSTFDTAFVAGGTNGGATSTHQTAFVGDLGINASYNVTRNLAVRLGYQFIWLTGVGLASDQVGTTARLNPPLVATPSLTFGDTYFHGLNAGVEFRW